MSCKLLLKQELSAVSIGRQLLIYLDCLPHPAAMIIGL